MSTGVVQGASFLVLLFSGVDLKYGKALGPGFRNALERVRKQSARLRLQAQHASASPVMEPMTPYPILLQVRPLARAWR
jgi:hypothetical protein